MKLLGLLLSTLLVLSAWGWDAIEFTDGTEEHLGHCYSKTENVGSMSNGEIKTLKGECVRATCRNNTAIYYEGCGNLGARQRCRKSTDEDLSKDYPHCCPKFEGTECKKRVY